MSTSHGGAGHDAAPDTRPLVGVRVIDLTQVLAGPYCTRLLADMGAEVIKVESPAGDPSRVLPPQIGPGHSGYFAWLNAGKKSIVADLRNAAGVALVRDLAAQADVVVENMRPGSLAAKGLGFGDLRTLNPQLIMCSISAFGNSGALAGQAGQGIIAEGMAGVIDMNGEAGGPPLPLGVSLADVSSGIHAYGAIVTALYKKLSQGGAGEYIDISLFDSCLPYHDIALMQVCVGRGEVNPTRNGNEHPQVVPYGVYEAPDAAFVLAAGTEVLWGRLSHLLDEALGASAEDLGTNARRIEARGVVRQRIETWSRGLGSARKTIEALKAAGVPAGPVEPVKNVPDSELARSRRSFVSLEDPVLGQIRILATPFRFSDTNTEPRQRAPQLGEHTAEIMAALARTKA
ncbi:MAG TPA: CoA transferase [Castellaniella sp.]|uniref:CaiB/BaiF CoA transferase family protein n=1 Tax=Castellaniella sp. TaxID=1955812 RepID=UPI002F1DC11C